MYEDKLYFCHVLPRLKMTMLILHLQILRVLTVVAKCPCVSLVLHITRLSGLQGKQQKVNTEYY